MGFEASEEQNRVQDIVVGFLRRERFENSNNYYLIAR
jgi:hypothetical protein